VSRSVACPEGPLAEALRASGVAVHPIGGTAGSLRLHPLHTTRALAELLGDAIALRRLAVRLGVDLVHANSIRAGLAAILAARLGGAPPVVHVRDCLPPGRATRAIRELICRGAAAVVSNSRFTQERFLVPGSRVRARPLHSPVDLERFDPERVDREEARRGLGLRAEDVVLGVVAQLTPWKGQDLAIRALGRLRESQPAARLLLVGSAKFTSAATRYDNRAYERSLERLVEELGLGDRVLFAGERDDVPRIMSALDVLLMPSWEEPMGRAVAEAMAMGVPVVATAVGGPGELISDGSEGLLLPPRDPERWALALEPLIADAVTREAMGRAGLERARRELGTRTHAEATLAVYRDVVAADWARPKPGRRTR
jgi:glycosyltransferase involved in cell wall biosynthesis